MVFGCGIAGLPIPMGLFMPNMLMGATLGRLCGQAAHALGFTYLADPGVFALIGAGAMLGAFTRMTITVRGVPFVHQRELIRVHCMTQVAVLLVEATADLTILAPMMLGISVAKLVAQSLVHHLDHVLLGMKAIPYLETDTPDVLANKVASDIVVKVPTVFERSSIALLQKVLG
jgi:chloride channel 7